MRATVRRDTACALTAQRILVAVEALAIALPVPWPCRAESPDEVVVHGSVGTSASRDSVSASQTVRGEELREPGASAADVLARLPGIQVSRTGASSDLATAAIRGATSAQTPVYLAGIRLNDDVTGTTDLSALPLFLIDRLEVYRGNAPADADQLGIGGAIFFEPRLPQRTQMGGGVTVGSFGERSGFLTSGVRERAAGALLAVGYDRADNDFQFRGPEGDTRKRQNADFEATSVWAITRIKPSARTRMVSVVHAYDRDQGAPGLALLPDDAARSRFRRLLGATNLQVSCSPDGTDPSQCQLQFVTSALRSSNILIDPLVEVIPQPVAWAVGDRFNQSIRMKYEATDHLALSAAADAAFEQVDVGLIREDAIHAQRYSVRPLLKVVADLTPWTQAVAMLSADVHETRRSPDQERSNVFETSGRAGVQYILSNGIQMRSNVGRYTRLPTLGELYGITSTVRGNAALESETGVTGDAGVRFAHSAGIVTVDADLFAFARESSNLIAYRRTSPSTVSPYNVGQARIVGIEAALGLAALEHVRSTLSLTAMDPRDTSNDREEQNDILPYRSRLVAVASGELFTNSGFESARITRASLGVRLTHRSSKYADSAGLLVIDEQTALDSHAMVSLLDGTLSLRIAVANVLDAREFDSIGLPLPGRSAHLSVEARLE